MFDPDTKIVLFALGAAAFLLGALQDASAPPDPPATVVDAIGLPAIPATARADGAPAQTRVTQRDLPLGEGFEARLLHGYALEGRVVTRRVHRGSATSAVSPLDLGIVWGALAETGGTQGFEFTAVPRGVRYRAGAEAALFDGWEERITNNHLIPADGRVHDALMAVEVGARIRIRGYLVAVTGDGIAPWRSSTRRDDNTLIGGCEIILVTAVETLPETQAEG